jgi:hypothetical protein
MKPKIRVILEDCIERGIERGYRLAFKHSESPLPENIQVTVYSAVMNEISEYFSFEDELNDNDYD